MIKNILKIGQIFLVVILLFSACDIYKNETEQQTEFFKIFQDVDFNSKNYPVDIKEMTDGSFLVLSSFFNDENTYVWHTPQIAKTDELGNILWQVELAAPYVNPAGEILIVDDNFYFVCMNETTLATHLMKINIDDGTTENVATFDDITYPTYAFVTSDKNILIQGYNHLNRRTIFAKINSSFEISWNQEYYLNEDAEEMIISHITKAGKQFPFKIGELSDGNYFFNGFYNYTFSTLFIDKSSGSINGLVNGYRYEGAISSMTEISSGNFALSLFNQGNNFFFTNQAISTSSTSSIENLVGIFLPELQHDARVVSGVFNINDQEMIVFASTTKDNQIVIYFYDKSTGELLETKNISDTNPVEIHNLTKSADNNIVIIGRTYVNGSFSRVFIAKIQ